MIISCRNPSGKETEKLPCQFRNTERRRTTSIFSRMNVKKYDSNLYQTVVYSRSPVSCAVLGLCLNIWAFIYKPDKQCYLHKLQGSICSRSEVPLNHGSKLMIVSVRKHLLYVLKVSRFLKITIKSPARYF